MRNKMNLNHHKEPAMKNLKLLLCALPLLLSACGVITYSEGDRAGSVAKLSHKGFICQTWEGELVMGGMTTTSDGNAAANVFSFSVIDEELVKQLQDAMDRNAHVKLTYRQVLFPWICSMDTDYKIVAVRTSGP